jgi:hypothetical protein
MPEERMQRRLAAILAADIAGYGRCAPTACVSMAARSLAAPALPDKPSIAMLPFMKTV